MAVPRGQKKKINTKSTKKARRPQSFLINSLCELCVKPLCSSCFNLFPEGGEHATRSQSR